MSNQGRKKLFNMNEKCVNVSDVVGAQKSVSGSGSTYIPG